MNQLQGEAEAMRKGAEPEIGGDYNIIRVLYTDDLNETIVSDCILN